MILDSEDQRRIILGLIAGTPLNGTLDNMSQACQSLNQLRDSVAKATLNPKQEGPFEHKSKVVPLKHKG